METQLERISAVECRVRVQIPWEEISPRFNQKLRELQGKARLPGFRPGKVPPAMVEKLFGKSVREELARDIVQETFQSAVTAQGKVPLTQPVLEEGTSVSRGEPFKYAARFEVPPDLQPKDYTGVPVRRRPAVADETKIDGMLKAKQDELTVLKPIETERQTQVGDVWTVDIDGTFGAQKVSGKDVKIEIGATQGEFLPGISKTLEDLQTSAVGSTRQVNYLPPQERIRSEYRGQEAKLSLGFRNVQEKHVPALDDEFARDCEAESLEELKTKFRDQVREEDQNEAERDARKRLVEALLERNPFEVAPSLVAREVAAQVDLFKRQLQQQGIKLQQTGMSENQVAAQMRPQAQFNVKAFLLLDAIGKAESVVVDEAEVDKELAELAKERGQNIDRLRATMEKNNQLLLLRAQIREEKILDLLMSKSEVTEAPDPEASKLIETEADASAEPATGGDAAT